MHTDDLIIAIFLVAFAVFAISLVTIGFDGLLSLVGLNKMKVMLFSGALSLISYAAGRARS